MRFKLVSYNENYKRYSKSKYYIWWLREMYHQYFRSYDYVFCFYWDRVLFFAWFVAGEGDWGHAPLLNTVAIIFLIRLKSCRKLVRPFFDLKYCTNLVWVFDFLDCTPCATSYTASAPFFFSNYQRDHASA